MWARARVREETEDVPEPCSLSLTVDGVAHSRRALSSSRPWNRSDMICGQPGRVGDLLVTCWMTVSSPLNLVVVVVAAAVATASRPLGLPDTPSPLVVNVSTACKLAEGGICSRLYIRDETPM